MPPKSKTSFATKRCISCSVYFSVSTLNPTRICFSCTEEEMIEEYKQSSDVVSCFNHDWIWSGVPKGSVWCRKCDTTYKEKDHGPIKDLAEMLR